MTDRTIASRPSLAQVTAIVEFMELNPALALGQLRGLEGRDLSKKLWAELTKIANTLPGPTRPMKSWIKYWADKKSAVRSKVQSEEGATVNLNSSIDQRIWDLIVAHESSNTKTQEKRSSVKQETYLEDNFFNEDSMDENHVESEPVLAFEAPSMDAEERQVAIMEKLVKVMGEQASAMSQLAQAALANSRAMERLAEASHIQARAIERLATSFESIGASTHDVRTAIVEIDNTMKRFYSTAPT